MKFIFYTHSLVSDWNHGNAHFLRGIMRQLNKAGHVALALEPEDSWSRENLLREGGEKAIQSFHDSFPDLTSQTYGKDHDHEATLSDADVVVVHEWSEPSLVERIGRIRRDGGRFTLLFHDTHHRAVSSEHNIASLRLQDYDGVLAFGETLRQRYLDAGWGTNVFTWHEAADTTVFHPLPVDDIEGDLIWIGNWGDNERSAEIIEYLIDPVHELDLKASVYGVRYPAEALDALKAAGISYRGWIANAQAPSAFSRYKMTVHIPRRPYVKHLPGIPTIRVFEALACGIPLISAPWKDDEGLFRPGQDYLTVSNGGEMKEALRSVLSDPMLAAQLVKSGAETIRDRHTCAHRVSELFDILRRCGTARVKTALTMEDMAL
ncbi:glycosyltransferase [uncultured Agrobacterium sp.]|uniref:CgeB family protein n=1 Tax=uncultured Agrobacterium sp. TaxID=157277 RepID=UPI0025FFD4E2|nr:glycosyltransferase [uncultured Agrobacterium sp.]